MVSQRPDRQRWAGAVVRTAPLHIADLNRRVRSGARAAADVLDGEEVVADHDLDVATHVLLVLHGVGPVVLRVERIRAVVRVETDDRTGAARSTCRNGERVVLRAGRGVPRDVDDATR